MIMILKKMRMERGFTAKFIYNVLGIKQCTYSSYENSKRYPPISFFIGIKKIYNLNDSEILTLMQVVDKEVKSCGRRNKKIA